MCILYVLFLSAKSANLMLSFLSLDTLCRISKNKSEKPSSRQWSFLLLMLLSRLVQEPDLRWIIYWMQKGCCRTKQKKETRGSKGRRVYTSIGEMWEMFVGFILQSHRNRSTIYSLKREINGSMVLMFEFLLIFIKEREIDGFKILIIHFPPDF